MGGLSIPVPIELGACANAETKTDAKEGAANHLRVEPVLVAENDREGLKGEVEDAKY